VNLSTATINEFDGGMTENYIDSPANTYKLADNFLVNKNKKLVLRPGFDLINETSTRSQVAYNYVGYLINYEFDTAMLAQCVKHIYKYDSSSGWSTITGPSSGEAFASNSASSIISCAPWRGHLFLTTDAFTAPQKIYKNSTTYYLRTAGLPALSSTPIVKGITYKAYILAAAEFSALVAHAGSTTQHGAAQTSISTSTFYSSVSWSILYLQWFVSWLDASYNGVTAIYGHHEDAIKSSGWSYHVAQQSPAAPMTSTSYSTGNEIAASLNDFKSVFNTHTANATTHKAAGSGITAPDAVGFDTSLLYDYVYGFAYSYTYTVNGITYEDIGPVTLVQVRDVYEPGVVASALSNTISYSFNVFTSTNYDTSNLKLKVYRTAKDGTALHYLTSLSYAEGSLTYEDTTRDAQITGNEILYTSGGVLDNDPPPYSKYVWIENNVALWGNLYESSVYYPNRVRQAVEDDPDSVPSSLNSDFDEEVRGINGSRGKHIILCKNKIYRRDGYYDEFGNGTVLHDVISTKAGCINNLSCVQTEEGLFWAGNDGFYFTDGYQVTKISDGLETTYASSIASGKVGYIRGIYDQKRNLVIWAAYGSSGSSAATYNNQFYVLNLNFGIRRSSCFTTWSGTTNFSPSALATWSGDLWMANSKTDQTEPGWIFKFIEDRAYDRKIIAGSGVSSWPYTTIIYNYISPAFSMGDEGHKKFVSRISINACNPAGGTDDLSIQINSINDDDATSKTKALNPIRIRSSTGMRQQWARFPAGTLRCMHKQVQITNALTYIQNSDTIGLAAVSGTTSKTCTLNAGYTAPWDTYAIGYYLSFSFDNYATSYVVTGRSADTLTFSDPTQAVPTGTNKKWVLKGYPVGDSLTLQSYLLHYYVINESMGSHYGGTSGGNA